MILTFGVYHLRMIVYKIRSNCNITDLPLSDAVKKKLYDYVDYCNRCNDPTICNCSLIGCPETLATKISQAVSNEMSIHTVIVDAATIDKPGDLAALVTNFNPGDNLTILNIQKMNSQVRAIFVQVITDYSIDVVTGTGNAAVSFHLPLPKFTAFFPVKSKQDIPPEIEESIFYELDFNLNRTDIRKGIIIDVLQKHGLTITDDAANILTGYEISNELLKSKVITIRNRALAKGATVIGVDLIDENAAEIAGLSEIDSMDGREFEIFAGNLLRGNGFINIHVTPSSGDFGADVIAEKDDVRYAIQCKRYDSPVGVSAVQEVMASKSLHDCHVACVLTNSTYTPAAVELAKKNLVILWDRSKLKMLIDKASIT